MLIRRERYKHLRWENGLSLNYSHINNNWWRVKLSKSPFRVSCISIGEGYWELYWPTEILLYMAAKLDSFLCNGNDCLWRMLNGRMNLTCAANFLTSTLGTRLFFYRQEVIVSNQNVGSNLERPKIWKVKEKTYFLLGAGAPEQGYLSVGVEAPNLPLMQLEEVKGQLLEKPVVRTINCIWRTQRYLKLILILRHLLSHDS
ncbi:hypothetical protein CR513_18050, partial [Mucuna pruriens]